MSDLMNKICALFPSSFRASGLIAALMFLICLAAAESASAATYTVINTNDSGAGSLRAAIISANSTADNDTINFAIPASSCSVCTITLTSGELAVNSASTAGTLTITNTTGASNLRISGNGTSRIFAVNPGGNLTISGVTITNGGTTLGGSISGSGGGIFNSAGTVALTNSTVSSNRAISGGGIYNIQGTLTLTNSTVSGNYGGAYGGGIYNIAGGTVALTNSTVSGNLADNSGGGIYNIQGGITLTNSTVSGNTAIFVAGGIFNDDGTLNLTSVTVTKNIAAAACTICDSGITNSNSGTANLNNTIVAGNITSNTSASPDFSGAVSSTSSYNIIGNNRGTTGITNGTNGNQVGTPASPIDPRLAPLADNGGATQTHALLSDSPAIDKGSSFGLTTDQRGLARPLDNVTIPNAAGGDGADIGAFEAHLAPTAATVSISGRVMTASGRGIRNVRLILTDTNGQIRTATTTSFGYYRFDDVPAGETYILSAIGKRYTFSQPVQVLNISEETDGVNFIADSKESIKDF
ncbi:MAG: carboxypeptidase-like regulatory domain-containing protein [Acidobacteria bacterium]|nr:carboxypeptidase-like regulatory domain-containing protein [Acidobacteriota bacterium]MCA1636741.1 carboxypeptidase-like regulatory domain-containing protein [Acidobacteriota bacterium]